MILKNHPVIANSYFEETEDLGLNVFKYRRCDLLDQPDNYYYRINAVSVASSMIAYMEYNGKFHFDVGEQDCYFASFQMVGHDDISFGNERHTLGSNQFALLTPKISPSIVTEGPVRAIVIRFDPAFLENETAKQRGSDRWTTLPFGAVQSCKSAAVNSYYRYVRYVAAEINRPDSMFGRNPGALAHAAQTMAILLLESQTALLQPFDLRIKDGSNRQIQRVEEYIRTHLDLPMTLGDLAAVGKVSASTLHELFRRHRQCAPMQFVRKLRLEAVRRDLMSGMPFGSVTEVAYRWGFVHLGRFAEHYRWMFGESPSATLKKHRP